MFGEPACWAGSLKGLVAGSIRAPGVGGGKFMVGVGGTQLFGRGLGGGGGGEEPGDGGAQGVEAGGVRGDGVPAVGTLGVGTSGNPPKTSSALPGVTTGCLLSAAILAASAPSGPALEVGEYLDEG